ncbi:MAG: hypothetical protein HYU88_02640, partial [Chloroflexi bacterium]|nr:hypothetical protein [Chloroflexota bacterium]
NRGPSRDRRAEVILGPRVSMLEAISRGVGDTVWLRSGVEVFNVFFNELQKHRRATIQGDQTEGVDLPVLTLPALPVINPGTQDVEVRRNQTLTLAPGAYRKITVQQGATLILNGVYHIATLDVKNQGKVHFRGRSEVRIKNEMDTDNRAYIGPDPAISGLRASDIVLYVEGGDDRRGSGERDEEVGPTVVQIGTRNTILANVYAPNGTVWLKNDTKATGAFIGKRVRIGEHVELTLDSAF